MLPVFSGVLLCDHARPPDSVSDVDSPIHYDPGGQSVPATQRSWGGQGMSPEPKPCVSLDVSRVLGALEDDRPDSPSQPRPHKKIRFFSCGIEDGPSVDHTFTDCSNEHTPCAESRVFCQGGTQTSPQVLFQPVQFTRQQRIEKERSWARTASCSTAATPLHESASGSQSPSSDTVRNSAARAVLTRRWSNCCRINKGERLHSSTQQRQRPHVCRRRKVLLRNRFDPKKPLSHRDSNAVKSLRTQLRQQYASQQNIVNRRPLCGGARENVTGREGQCSARIHARPSRVSDPSSGRQPWGSVTQAPAGAAPVMASRAAQLPPLNIRAAMDYAGQQHNSSQTAREFQSVMRFWETLPTHKATSTYRPSLPPTPHAPSSRRLFDVLPLSQITPVNGPRGSWAPGTYVWEKTLAQEPREYGPRKPVNFPRIPSNISVSSISSDSGTTADGSDPNGAEDTYTPTISPRPPEVEVIQNPIFPSHPKYVRRRNTIGSPESPPSNLHSLPPLRKELVVMASMQGCRAALDLFHHGVVVWICWKVREPPEAMPELPRPSVGNSSRTLGVLKRIIRYLWGTSRLSFSSDSEAPKQIRPQPFVQSIGWEGKPRSVIRQFALSIHAETGLLTLSRLGLTRCLRVDDVHLVELGHGGLRIRDDIDFDNVSHAASQRLSPSQLRQARSQRLRAKATEGRREEAKPEEPPITTTQLPARPQRAVSAVGLSTGGASASGLSTAKSPNPGTDPPVRAITNPVAHFQQRIPRIEEHTLLLEDPKGPSMEVMTQFQRSESKHLGQQGSSQIPTPKNEHEVFNAGRSSSFTQKIERWLRGRSFRSSSYHFSKSRLDEADCPSMNPPAHMSSGFDPQRKGSGDLCSGRDLGPPASVDSGHEAQPNQRQPTKLPIFESQKCQCNESSMNELQNLPSPSNFWDLQKVRRRVLLKARSIARSLTTTSNFSASHLFLPPSAMNHLFEYSLYLHFHGCIDPLIIGLMSDTERVYLIRVLKSIQKCRGAGPSQVSIHHEDV